jgi:glycosyltransferase involved in cell wall biosynthesis
MAPVEKLAVEIWSPLPPETSGVADYVEEQLDTLDRAFALTLVVENPEGVSQELRGRYRVIAPAQSQPSSLRVYHVGNSPAHRAIYLEALRVPGVVVLHEWNLHELVLGFAVTAHDFDGYRRQMRREHGERGSIAALTVADALGGRYWSSLFPLNAEILERALAVVCLSGSTAARAATRVPGVPLLHLPHHALLKSHAPDRAAARVRLGFDEGERIVLAPGLGTASKSLDLAEAAVERIRARVADVVLVTAGSGEISATGPVPGPTRALGRVDLQTLGDAVLAADVVLALRFPSRGEASGVVMRSLAAGRALVVSKGSTADEDLPEGVVARVNPGPGEVDELAALLEFLLTHDEGRRRMEDLALTVAASRDVVPLTERLAQFLHEVAGERPTLESRMAQRTARPAGLRDMIRVDIEAAGASLGLAQLPPNVFERLEGL